MRRLPKPRIRPVVDAAWIADALSRADAILAAPPARAHVVRVKPAGALVVRFVLPLDCCEPQNRTRHGKPWVLGKLKERIGLLMFVQAQGFSRHTLPGRPVVRCVRFSSVEPDKYNDGFKFAIDRLTKNKGGLGFIRDDRPADCDVHQTWEYAPPKHGFGLVEVWTGATAVEAPKKPKRGGKKAA
jgi:hypothetical protein